MVYDGGLVGAAVVNTRLVAAERCIYRDGDRPSSSLQQCVKVKCEVCAVGGVVHVRVVCGVVCGVRRCDAKVWCEGMYVVWCEVTLAQKG